MVVASSSKEANGKVKLHPSYKEMIITAVGSLKERGGSSRRAISKFISTKYTDLSTKHDALLGTHLHRLQSSGLLVRLKNSYKLKPNVSLANQTPRAPGRPKKVVKGKPGRPKMEVKKRAGRPKKEAQQESLGERKSPRKIKKVSGAVKEVLERKKSPGRPKKVTGAVNLGMKKGPGRPKKDNGVVKKILMKRSPGRPKKENGAVQGKTEKKRVGRPKTVKKETEGKKEKEVGEKKKGPGRPKKEVK